MTTPNIIGLFPTPVLSVDLDRNFTEIEWQFFEEIGRDLKPNRYNQSSKDTYVLNNPELYALRQFFEQQLEYYQKTILVPKNDVKMRITQSWINHSTIGQGHHKHYHSNSYLSGVFYIQTNPEDKIDFFNDKLQHIDLSTKEWNVWNSHSWWLEAQQYRLYIFPSNLPHAVESVNGPCTRISLSFNAFPQGTFGDADEYTELSF